MKGCFDKPQLGELRRVVGFLLQRHAKDTRPQSIDEECFWRDLVESAKKIFPDDPDLEVGDLRNFASAVKTTINHFNLATESQRDDRHNGIVNRFVLLYNHIAALVRKHEGIKDGWHRT